MRTPIADAIFADAISETPTLKTLNSLIKEIKVGLISEAFLSN